MLNVEKFLEQVEKEIAFTDATTKDPRENNWILYLKSIRGLTILYLSLQEMSQ